MKILFLGSHSQQSGTQAYTRNLEKAGAEVRIFELATPAILSCSSHPVASALGGRISSLEVSLRFYRQCKAYRPDFILSVKSDKIHHRAIREATAATGAKFILWYGDNPFCAGVTSMYVIESLKDCAIYYTYARFLTDTLYSAGCRRVEYLPFGYDPVHHPFDIQVTDQENDLYSCDLCFVGTWDPERERILSRLVGFNIKIYGRLWNERVAHNSPLRPFIMPGIVCREEMSKRFKCAKIVFNTLRRFNWTSHNMRTMEATGIAGGALLTKRTPEQAAELFQENEHIFCYDNELELVAIVSELLSNSACLKVASRKAHEHVMKNHLFEYRCQKIINDLEKI